MLEIVNEHTIPSTIGTIEDSKAEFARIVAPHFREKLDEEPKKKRGSKKYYISPYRQTEQ